MRARLILGMEIFSVIVEGLSWEGREGGDMFYRSHMDI